MSYSKIPWLAALLIVLSLTVSPAQDAGAQGSESQSASDDAAAMQPVDPDTPTAPVDPKTFIIGAEDTLQIKVWREPEVSGSVTVRPDGMITLPLVGEVQAAGKTPIQLKEIVTEALSEFLTRPEVTVSVLSIRSKKYYLTGQVGRTGAVPLVMPTTVLEALSGAGGFGPWAKTKKIIILRGTTRFKFNYNQVIKGKNTEQNIYLEDGDHVIVP
jgi:polysaccharide export outer membrane protein